MRTIYASSYGEFRKWCQRCETGGMKLDFAICFDSPFDAALVGFPFDVRRHVGFVRYAPTEGCRSIEPMNIVQARDDASRGVVGVRPSYSCPPGGESVGPKLVVASRAFRIASEQLSQLACESPSGWPLPELTRAIDAIAAAAHAGNQLMIELTGIEIGQRLTEAGHA